LSPDVEQLFDQHGISRRRAHDRVRRVGGEHLQLREDQGDVVRRMLAVDQEQSKPAVAQISAVYGLASASHIPIWVRFSRSARLKGLAFESVMRRGGFAARGAWASSGQESAVPSRIQTQERDAAQTQPMPLYHTIVHNCNCHTFEDVIFGLMRIVGRACAMPNERHARSISSGAHRRHHDARGRRTLCAAAAQRSHQRERTLLGTSIEPA